MVGPVMCRGESPEPFQPQLFCASAVLLDCKKKPRQLTSKENEKGQGPGSGARAGLRVRSHVNKSVINLRPGLLSFYHLFRNASTIKWLGLFVLKPTQECKQEYGSVPWLTIPFKNASTMVL